MTRGGVEGYVNRSDIPLDRVMASVNYNVPLDCMWVITVEEGWKVRDSYKSDNSTTECRTLPIQIKVAKRLRTLDKKNKVKKDYNTMYVLHRELL